MFLRPGLLYLLTNIILEAKFLRPGLLCLLTNLIGFIFGILSLEFLYGGLRPRCFRAIGHHYNRGSMSADWLSRHGGHLRRCGAPPSYKVYQPYWGDGHTTTRSDDPVGGMAHIGGCVASTTRWNPWAAFGNRAWACGIAPPHLQIEIQSARGGAWPNQYDASVPDGVAVTESAG